MPWVVLSYSLSSATRSGLRVTLWRRLRRLGVLTLAGGSHLLPAREACVEAFQWLAQEIRQARGDAMVMRVQEFEGMTDQQLIDRFNAARREDYLAIAAQATALDKAIGAKTTAKARSRVRRELGKLRRQVAEVARVDYFGCPEGGRLLSQLGRIEQALSPGVAKSESVAPEKLTDYRNKRWVTRPRPHVDRLACAWLIRRFVDPKAVIRYAAHPKPSEIAFDMPEAQFGHQGNLCSFEKMLRAFGLDDPGLRAIAEIVHEIDLRDGRTVRPETAGIDAILEGWLRADVPDVELESRGIALFEGLYAALSSHSPAAAGKKRIGGL